MRRLLANELVKIRYSRSVKIVFFVLAAFTVLCTAIQAGDGGKLGNYGYQIPFVSITSFGAMGFFVYSALAATMIGGEFENGIVHNIFSCGIGRGKYYVVKLIGVFGAATAIYFMITLLQTVLVTLRFGFGAKELIGEKYRLEVLVFTVAVLIVLAANLSIYCFFAFLFRRAAVTFAVSVGWGTAELFISSLARKKGIDISFLPLAIMNAMIEKFQLGKVLSAEFCVLIFPCIVIVLLCSFLGYWLFTNRDIQ